MGEEEKKPEGKEEEKKGEEKKPAEEGKKEEAKEKKEEKAEEKGDGAEKEKVKEKEEAAPPEEIVLRVYMHCEGCARKVRRCLKGFEGVEDVQTDCKAHKVVVKGKKADPLKVLERIQKKSHRKVELLTPIPKPPVEEKKPEEKKEEEKPKVEEKKEEEPPVIVVVLKVHLHCEACAQNIEKCIMKMKGVQAAVPDYKSSQVTVKGVFEPAKLVEYVYKRAKKHAVIVKEEVEKKAEDKPKEGDEKKDGKDDGSKDGKDAGSGEKKDGKDGGEEGQGVEDVKDEVKTELKKNDHYSTKYYTTEYVYAPDQIFSDENPNACSVM